MKSAGFRGFAIPGDQKRTEQLWTGMPEFVQEDQTSFASILVNFRRPEDHAAFLRLIGEKNEHRTRSLWYPRIAQLHRLHTRTVVTKPNFPRYPIYVISKGRWEKRLTVRALDRLSVPYSVVIEPQEYDQYAAVIDPQRLLVLPFSNLGQGSIPARNWVWEHAKKSGVKRHWILDDNIYRFYRLHRNQKTPVTDGTIFLAAEDFIDRYENVAMAGFQYDFFVPQRKKVSPIALNTRIYSCIILRNDLPFRWRGRYNEDTDLSIRILKAGWCTVLFYAFLAKKVGTMTQKGGNTEELYSGDGRLKMAESLQNQHPDIVTITQKWGRPQHHVNYRAFRHNKLKLCTNRVLPVVNNYGMEFEKLDPITGEWKKDQERTKPL